MQFHKKPETVTIKTEPVAEIDETFKATQLTTASDHDDEPEHDVDTLTLVDGITVPKDGSKANRKRKKKTIGEDKILLREQEKVMTIYKT